MECCHTTYRKGEKGRERSNLWMSRGRFRRLLPSSRWLITLWEFEGGSRGRSPEQEADASTLSVNGAFAGFLVEGMCEERWGEAPHVPLTWLEIQNLSGLLAYFETVPFHSFIFFFFVIAAQTWENFRPVAPSFCFSFLVCFFV